MPLDLATLVAPEHTALLTIEVQTDVVGDDSILPDLAAAAHLSVVDYLGDLPWSESEHVKSWYARMKSRPSFRPILAEVSGALPPAPHYADPDF